MRTTGLIRFPVLFLLTMFFLYGCTVNHNLEISRHTNANLTNQRADEILADMGEILQTKDGDDDVACRVRFTRDGDVGTFATAGGLVNSQANFNAINGLAGNVKVVNQITWCGDINPSYIGCAPVPGTSFVVERFTAASEGVLWAHEFGHNKGLGHRDVTNVVMRAFIGVNHRLINQDECTAFRSQ